MSRSSEHLFLRCVAVIRAFVFALCRGHHSICFCVVSRSSEHLFLRRVSVIRAFVFALCLGNVNLKRILVIFFISFNPSDEY